MRRINELTNQEYRVLTLVSQGWRTAIIARELFLSPRTVEAHLYRIFDKLDVSSRTEAALYAVHNGLLPNAEINRISDDRENARHDAGIIR